MSMYVSDKKETPVGVVISIIATVLTLGYMLPWMIAALRGKSNHIAIMLVNLFLGWTIVGWIVAFVMSCMAHQIAPRYPYYYPQQYPPPPQPQYPPQQQYPPNQQG